MDRRPEPEVMDIAERAAAYARADFREVNRAFVARLFELAPRERGHVCLDLGTGPGDIAVMASMEGPKWDVVALDASPPMLRFARDRLQRAGRPPNLAFVLADAKRTPFPNHTFDIVFSNSILHHVIDPIALWQETKRLLRPGGLIFFRDLLRPETPEAARHIVETHAGQESPLLKEDFYNSLLAAFTIEEVRAQLKDAGLTYLRVEQRTDRHIDVYGRAP